VNEASRRDNLVLPWPVVGAASLILAVTSLAALAVVAAVRGADALSTVALSLAILAFVIQIVVFIVQTAASHDQSVRSEQIYAETLRLLATIEAKAAGTEATLAQMQNRLLDSILPKVRAQAAIAASDDLDADDVVRLALRGASSLTSDLRSDPDDEQIVQYLTSLPNDEEGAEAASRLLSLGASRANTLATLAYDEVRSRRPESSLAPGLRLVSPDAELVDAGLITKDPNTDLWVLTPNGRRLGRFFTAQGAVPDYIPEKVRDWISERRREQEPFPTRRTKR
jgi:hypothetical protein